MSASKWRGVFSIPVTPFNEDGSVDYESLSRCVAYCVEAGAHGIVMPVNASEGPTLTDAERIEVIRTGVAAVSGAVPFVAGISGQSPQHVVELAKAAADAGADSVIAMPPQNCTGAQEQWDYYAAIAGATGLPVWMQNNKPPTSPSVSTDLMVRMLRELSNVDFVKEESAYPGHVITQLIKQAGPHVKSIMGGMGGRFLLDEFHRGSSGTMPAGHITEAHVRLWEALERGRKNPDGTQEVTDEARAIWEQMLPALNFEFQFSIQAYKATFWKRGIIRTPVTRVPARRPFDDLDAAELDTILKRLSPLLKAKVRV